MWIQIQSACVFTLTEVVFDIGFMILLPLMHFIDGRVNQALIQNENKASNSSHTHRRRTLLRISVVLKSVVFCPTLTKT